MEVTAEPNEHPIISLEHFLKAMGDFLRPMLHLKMRKYKNITFSVIVNVQYTHPKRDLYVNEKTKSYDTQGLQSGRKTLINPSEIDDKLDAAAEDIMNRNANFIRDKSGLVLEDIVELKFFIFKKRNLYGRSYKELPKFLKSKHAIINVKNRDNRCFGYAVLSALSEIQHHADAPYQYCGLFAQYGLNQLDYPVTIADIPAIEDILLVTINVFSFGDDQGRMRYPLYISKKVYPKCIDLLYWEEHYAWIKNFSFFMADVTKGNHKLYWCKACLGHFRVEHEYKTHLKWCRGFEEAGQIFITPEPWQKVKFDHQAYVPLLILLIS